MSMPILYCGGVNAVSIANNEPLISDIINRNTG